MRDVERWLNSLAPEAPKGPRVELVGGPGDGFSAAIAEASFRCEGGEMFLPAMFYLAGPHGEITHVEHVYVREAATGYYAYLGTRPISGVAP